MIVQSVKITSFAVTGNSATFSGTCRNRGAACTFEIRVVDNGNVGFQDEFQLRVRTGPNEYFAGGVLLGDIRVVP